MNSPVSIVIPCKEINDYARECIQYCQALDYPDFEIIVSPDLDTDIQLSNVTVIPSGPVGPAEKRDLMANHANGELIAFIDDDAYPEKYWLKEAAKHFDDQEVAAVAGPAVTPSNDNILQKSSGWVYSSFTGGGSHRYRYIPGGQREVDDYPSCNFIVRKSIFDKLGGFSTSYWPGEDTKLCMEITNKLHKKIIYDPEVLVYHHRRELFIPHLKQIWNYAVHRGYFVKKFPQTSLRVSYFLPSILSIGIILGIPLSFVHPVLMMVYLITLATYLLIVIASSLEARDIRAILLVSLGIISTHLIYGIGFIKGLLTRVLEK